MPRSGIGIHGYIPSQTLRRRIDAPLARPIALPSSLELTVSLLSTPGLSSPRTILLLRLDAGGLIGCSPAPLALSSAILAIVGSASSIRPKWPKEVILGFPAPRPLAALRLPPDVAAAAAGVCGRLLLFVPARIAGGASRPFANLSLSLLLVVEGPASPTPLAVTGRRYDEGKTRLDEVGSWSRLVVE